MMNTHNFHSCFTKAAEEIGQYSKLDVNNQITKLVKSLCDFRKMK